MSSIESAPATIPATSEATFNPAFAPLSVGTDRCCWARRCNPAASASPSTGTNPAADTRPGSSNTAEVAFTLWESCIREMPFLLGELGPSTSPILQVSKGILASRHAQASKIIGASGLRGTTGDPAFRCDHGVDGCPR
jgi:hypothetical protein